MAGTYFESYFFIIRDRRLSYSFSLYAPCSDKNSQDQACRHAVLMSDGVAVSGFVDLSTDDAGGHRVPFGVLQSLHQSLPASSSADTSNGHFSGIVSRVKVIYRTAKIWLEDIEKLTEVQPRRSTARRVQKNTSQRDNAEDGAECLDVSPIIDVRKIAELSNSPILLKVRLLDSNRF